MKICLVPCFNEEGRFKLDYWKDLIELIDLKLIFVNDGSTDSTGLILAQSASKFGENQIHVINLPVNRGKAEALRSGLAYSLTNFNKVSAIGFMDADSPVAVTDIQKAFNLAEKNPQYRVISGARIVLAGNSVSRSLLRGWIGRIIASIVSGLLGIKYYDPQSPCKVLNLNNLNSITLSHFESKFRTKWFFDAELFLRMGVKDGEILEFPTTDWQDVPGSHLGFRQIITVIFDLLKLNLEVFSSRNRGYPDIESSGRLTTL